MESKSKLLLSGQNTNTMATGNPKVYKSTDAHEDSSNESQKPNINGAMSLVGSGVAVASIVNNAGDISKAGEQITAAAIAAVANKTTEIIGEYSTKFVSLPLSIPSKITQYTTERFNKTDNDKDENGNKYDPVKKSLGDALKLFNTNSEELNENEDNIRNEINNNKTIDNAKKKAQEFIVSANKIIEKSNEAIGKIMEHSAEGVDWLQKNIDKEISRAESNIKDNLENGLKTISKDIDLYCKNEGNKIGSKLVSKYNKLLEEQAKDIVDKKNKAESKAKIKANASIQKAKLKIFALIGL